MAASLSAYWVKFFKGAGFSQDVATKHAVVFSNNRIKPDMLPDLDKPSLKEMGIILMGDMIAILRYAKKVVEETTCERFLVDSEDTPLPLKTTQPVVKKIMKDNGNKTVVPSLKTEPVKKSVKPLTTVKKIVNVKKPISTLNITANAEYPSQKKQIPIKRKLVTKEVYDGDDNGWSEKKKTKVLVNNSEDDIEYTVTVPKVSNVRTQQILKKPVEQKRTVFDRLGDSSVTSTTNLADTTPTFNITGIGKDVFKRSASVFKRLGDIDDKKDYIATAGILKNGSSNNNTSSILKNRIPDARTTIITTKRVVPKTTGTMHADHEANKKIIVNNTSRILKLEKKSVSSVIPSGERITRVAMPPGKLASERLISIPAKARLGAATSKQVTFSKETIVTHVKKAGVFSRLGV